MFRSPRVGLSVRLLPGSTNGGSSVGRVVLDLCEWRDLTGCGRWSGSGEKCRIGFWVRHLVGFPALGAAVGAEQARALALDVPPLLDRSRSRPVEIPAAA